MEPSDDLDLRQVLREWKAPGAPATLRDRVLPPRQGWLRWLFTGTIRIPVPVGAAAALLAGLWLYANAPGLWPANDAPVVSLADFQPVARLEPVVIGGVK